MVDPVFRRGDTNFEFVAPSNDGVHRETKFSVYFFSPAPTPTSTAHKPLKHLPLSSS